MNLRQLIDELSDVPNAPMFQDDESPIKAETQDEPIIPMERWVISNNTGMLKKTYKFMRSSFKSKFVIGLMKHELETQHAPKLEVDEERVVVSYITKDVDKVTEIDKECAAFCDSLYKDVVSADE